MGPGVAGIRCKLGARGENSLGMLNGLRIHGQVLYVHAYADLAALSRLLDRPWGSMRGKQEDYRD
jgi:hypothetical protein